MNPNRPPRRRFSMQAASRLMLGLLVCVSVLQFPMPVMHCHDHLAFHGEVAEHMDALQHETSISSDDLHWHMMLPGDRDGDGDDSDDGLPLDVVATGFCDAIVVGSDAIGPFLEILVPRVDSAVRARLSASADRFCRSPFDVSPAVRTCAVLCVMRV